MQFRSLVKELRYSLAAPRNWRSRAELLLATVRFHIFNALRMPHPAAAMITLDLRIGKDARTVTMRPASGDVFILYEVFAFDSYFIPDPSLDPASVKTIIDCGANIGLTALYLASRYPNARIVCVEPDPQNFLLLQKNIAGEPRIQAMQGAIVGSPTEYVTLTQSHETWGNRIASASDTKGGETATVEVAGLTIDDVCTAHEFSTIDLLKVDIEGGEADMFAQASFLTKVGTIMIELHGFYSLDRFRQDIAPFGFDAAYDPVNGAVGAVTARQSPTA